MHRIFQTFVEHLSSAPETQRPYAMQWRRPRRRSTCPALRISPFRIEHALPPGIRCGFTVPIHDNHGLVAAVTFAAVTNPSKETAVDNPAPDFLVGTIFCLLAPLLEAKSMRAAESFASRNETTREVQRHIEGCLRCQSVAC
jgi:hypothetical protein